MAKLEEDTAALEAEGAKADAKRKVREGAEREVKQRDRAQRELDRLDAVWTRFKNLKVQDLEGDEVLYREMKTRFGKYSRARWGPTRSRSGWRPSTSRARPPTSARPSRPARASARPAP